MLTSVLFQFFSSGVKEGSLSRKDEIYNAIVNKFEREMLDFPKEYAETDGKYFVQLVFCIVCQGRI